MTGRALVVITNPNHEAVEVGRLYRKAKASIVDSAKCLAEAGLILAEKKESLGHGNWLPWLTENEGVLGFGERTARMMISGTSNRKLASDLTEADALEFSRKLWGHKPANRLESYSGDDEWYTPALYIGLAREVMGTIDVDPASNSHAQKTVKATRFYTTETNGLTKGWNGAVWMNPPYSNPDIQNFISKVIEEYAAKRTTQAIVLTNNSGDTVWHQSLAEVSAARCITRGRVKFESTTRESNSPAMGQSFFYLGKRVAKFAEVFAEIGRIEVNY